MIDIFDFSKLPDRRFHARRIVSKEDMLGLGDSDFVSFIKSDLSHLLAREILEKGAPLFDVVQADVCGCPMIEFRADCIVLTSNEFHDLMKLQFAKGVKQAAGFRW